MSLTPSSAQTSLQFTSNVWLIASSLLVTYHMLLAPFVSFSPHLSQALSIYFYPTCLLKPKILFMFLLQILPANSIRPMFKRHHVRTPLPSRPPSSILAMWDSVKIFPFIEDALGYGPKLPSCKPKVGACDTLNQSKFKDS